MQVDSFYQTQAEDALPLWLVPTGHTQWTHDDQAYLQHQNFTGKLGEVCVIVDPQGKPLRAYSGLGDKQDYPIALAHAALRLPPGNYQLAQTSIPDFALTTWALAQYRFDQYKAATQLPKILIVPQEKCDKIQHEAEAIFMVRDLINAPANAMGPQHLSATMSKLADKFKANFEEWIGDELLKANFPAIHMVGRASAHAPRLLRLTWGNPQHPKLALVGKGVCFDSGGLDIKPSSGMRLMKKDMGGAAHVLGLAQWIMANRLAIRLEVLIPAVENAIGPDAFRPGDIVVMRNGLSVEIDNTDAEGRLILADALVKACENKPELIIDFATLTGAARIAVGTEIAALFANQQQLADQILSAAHAVNDPIWQLPLFVGYESMLDSSVADLVNSTSGGYAGAITAALFLQRFVTKDTPWLHFDIMAWNIANKPGKPEGGEAMAIRAIAYYLENKYGIKED